jgi:hypothetical protein
METRRGVFDKLNTHYRLVLRRRCCRFLRQGHPNAGCAALSDLSPDRYHSVAAQITAIPHCLRSVAIYSIKLVKAWLVITTVSSAILMPDAPYTPARKVVTRRPMALLFSVSCHL